MFFKSCAVLALATGFAAATPINARTPEELPSYQRREDSTPAKRGNDFNFNRNNNDNFNFFDSFNQFNNQDFEFQQVNVQNVQQISENNGIVQLVQEQVKQVLIQDNRNNFGRNRFNDLSRRSFFRNENRDFSTVIMVVKQVQVSVDDGFGNQFEQDVFAQNILVANRGRRASSTVLMITQETLVARNILDFNGNRNGFANGFGGGFGGGISGGVSGGISNGVNGNLSIPTPTRQNINQDIQLFGQRPTWSAIVEDPAFTVGPAWQNEILDSLNVDNINGDQALNLQLAALLAQQH